MADDVVELVRALRERLNEAELAHVRTPARIWVTAHAPAGSMLDVPYLDDQGRETGRRQLLVHPDDWTQIEALAVEADSKLLAAFGIPVVKEDRGL